MEYILFLSLDPLSKLQDRLSNSESPLDKFNSGGISRILPHISKKEMLTVRLVQLCRHGVYFCSILPNQKTNVLQVVQFRSSIK
jgi:hypothetical protein